MGAARAPGQGRAIALDYPIGDHNPQVGKRLPVALEAFGGTSWSALNRVASDVRALVVLSM